MKQRRYFERSDGTLVPIRLSYTLHFEEHHGEQSEVYEEDPEGDEYI